MKPVPGVRRGSKLRLAARLIGTARLADVRGFEDQLAAQRSVDGVHDMRVATRRLRATLQLFYGSSVASEGVKALADALGEVRDRHVQQAWLAQVAPPLATEIGKELPAAERALLVGLHESTFRAVPRLVLALARAKPEGKLSGGKLRRRLRRRFGEVRACLAAIDPTHLDAELAHQLRISVKKLRYQLEVLEPFFGKPYRRVIERLTALQEELGELHDADVRLALLKRLKAPAKLSRRVAADRRTFARALVADLAHWQEEEILEKLARRVA